MPTPSHKYRDPTIKTTHAYTIAHAAQCKLHMSASDPDRNLRFMLGHAFLLDKALYRVAEVEEDFDDPGDEEQENLRPQVAEALVEENDEGGIDGDGVVEGQSGSLAGGRVKFDGGHENNSRDPDQNAPKPTPTPDMKKQAKSEPDGDRTPPDEDLANLALNDDDDNDRPNLGLTRFASASERPPRMIPDEGDDQDEDEELDEAISPPSLPADLDVSTIVAGPESEDMTDLYERVRGCPCHGLGEKAEKGRKFWEVRGKDGTGELGRSGKRMAIMQVEA